MYNLLSGSALSSAMIHDDDEDSDIIEETESFPTTAVTIYLAISRTLQLSRFFPPRYSEQLSIHYRLVFHETCNAFINCDRFLFAFSV